MCPIYSGVFGNGSIDHPERQEPSTTGTVSTHSLVCVCMFVSDGFIYQRFPLFFCASAVTNAPRARFMLIHAGIPHPAPAPVSCQPTPEFPTPPLQLSISDLENTARPSTMRSWWLTWTGSDVEGLRPRTSGAARPSAGIISFSGATLCTRRRRPGTGLPGGTGTCSSEIDVGIVDVTGDHVINNSDSVVVGAE